MRLAAEDVDTVKRELSSKNHRWLLIFDNAPNSGELIDKYLPLTGAGHVLITSRNPDWQDIAITSVTVFRRDESTAFLLKRTKQPDTAATQVLAEELGDLPLALAQAAAYIKATSIPLAQYLGLFQAQRQALWADELPPGDYDHKHTVTTTYSLAIEQIARKSSLGEHVLRLLAYLGGCPKKNH